MNSNLDKAESAVAFRTAKNKKDMIYTQADLNLCAPAEIAQILDDMGELKKAGLKVSQFSTRYVPIAYAPHKRGVKKGSKVSAEARAPFDEIRAMQLFEDGLDDNAMADALGIKAERVAKWRRRMHLLRPRGGNMKARKKEVEHVEDQKSVEDAAPETVEATEAAAADEGSATMTLDEFFGTVKGMLAPAAMKADLYINGAAVALVEQIVIRSRDGRPCVEICTEAPRN